MPTLSFTFNIDEPPHNGISFRLIAEKSSNSGFCIPLQSTSTAFHRILYQLNKIALVSVISTESNSLLVTFFNFSRVKAKQLCETAISILHSPITFSILETEFVFDPYVVKAAYEALIARTLEQLDWWLLKYSQSIILFNQSGIMISDFKINSNPSLQFVSQLIKKSNSSSKNKISINLSGQTLYKQIPIFSLPNKVLQKTLDEKGSVDLDYLPCRVLPKFTQAFVVSIINVKNCNQANSPIDSSQNEISSKAIQEIKDYWKYSHGMILYNIKSIAKIAFKKEGEKLTYPIECVVDPNNLSDFTLKKNKIDFEKNLEDHISTTLDVVALNQKSKF